MATQSKSGKETAAVKDTEAAQPVEEQAKAEVKKAPAKKKTTSAKAKTTKAASESTKEVKAKKTTNAKTAKTAKTAEAVDEPVKKVTKKTAAKSAEKAESSQKATTTRAPQMITPNGGKVTHAHFFQSTHDASKWYMTAKIDGVQLHVKEVSPKILPVSPI